MIALSLEIGDEETASFCAAVRQFLIERRELV
jgi:hypothetical protein